MATNPANPTHRVQPHLAYGTTTFNIPVPRNRAEAWRHFDVPGLVKHDFPAVVSELGGVDMDKLGRELEEDNFLR